MNKAVENYSQHFTLAELIVHALVIELEAVQSYKDLKEQMEECGNSEVAGLFEEMSKLEAGHAEKIREKAGFLELPELAPWEFRWAGLEPPENIDLAGVHYLMTPYQALALALENEQSAVAFFDAIAHDCTDRHIRSMAQEFADDERQHVAWLKEWLAKYPAPDADWDHDPDPPVAID